MSMGACVHMHAPVQAQGSSTVSFKVSQGLSIKQTQSSVMERLARQFAQGISTLPSEAGTTASSTEWVSASLSSGPHKDYKH